MLDDLSRTHGIAKQRIRQVFEYLKALNHHRNPAIRQVREQPWMLWLDDLPREPNIELPRRAGALNGPDGDANSSNVDFILRVRRPRLTPSPAPPEEIRGWLRPGWDDPHAKIEHLEVRNDRGPNGETITIRFLDDPSRLNALNRWSEKRTTWQSAELPVRASMDVFNKLYALHGQLDREGERFDLVIGDGILSWDQVDGGIFHPLLLQRVQLEFDPRIPEFKVVDAEFSAEFHASLLQSIAEVEPGKLRSRREEFEAAGFHPLDEEVSGFLEALANQLSAQGRFVGKKRPDLGATDPQIGRSPVLFLRSRTKGFGSAIDNVLEGMREREEFCAALTSIVGCDVPGPKTPENQPDNSPVAIDANEKQILFGKPSNREQIRIAQSIDRHGSVLVQGPPGTGKSHTIANLIGHLLAHGQSVLVTSHTTKALRVLREHLVETLRPLCVSVLESDTESRRQLEQSVHEISSRLSESDAGQLEREARWLADQRSQLLEELSTLKRELQAARADEYREVTLAGKGLAPSEAARLVAQGVGINDWIPGPVSSGEPCPLSQAEARELFATNITTQQNDDRFVDARLPEVSSLPKPADFATAFTRAHQTSGEAQANRRYWPAVHFTTAHIEILNSLIPDLQAAVQEYSLLQQWELTAADTGRTSDAPTTAWHRLLQQIDTTSQLARVVESDLIVFRPLIDQSYDLHEQASIAREITQHLRDGGSLSRISVAFRPKWRRMLSAWKVNDAGLRSLEHAEVVERFLSLSLARIDLRRLWGGLMAAQGGPPAEQLGAEPERSASTFVDSIQRNVQWWSLRWIPLQVRLAEAGFAWQQFLSEQPPVLDRFGEMHRVIWGVRDRLLGELQRTRDNLSSLRVQKQVTAIVGSLKEFQGPEVEDIRGAITTRDADAYERAYHRLLAAAERKQHAIRRRDLLHKLQRRGADGTPVAEPWAEEIIGRVGSQGESTPPGDVRSAWEWRQLHDELERRSERDLDALGARIVETQNQLHTVTNELIDRLAWSGQVRRTGPQQRRALIGWLDIVKRIGKGFGKRVALLRREAQQNMEECREAVPVWVMPLSRLVENFDFSAPRFDVVIIDEASQCDVMALIAFALARRVVVVGDDKQVSPSAVGQKLDIVEQLIGLHLDGIPLKVLYDGKMSVYQLAKQSFSDPICLVEHFRCVPDIIQFSNQLSYDGRIRPLRANASSPVTPHVVAHRVDGAIRDGGQTNQREAVEIASLIVATCEQEAYADQTFGVVSLLGDDQAIEIERLLLQHLRPDEYQRRRIICGNSAQFQGDERHVIFLSMVQSPGDGPLAMQDREEMRQRYNVAASRAQNQMWVVYSLNHQTDLKPGDLRRRLIEHALDPQAITREMEKGTASTDSPFESEVLERLIREGFHPRTQWRVGYYRIDLAFPECRVAIECDGNRYHPIEKLPDDIERQAVLERLGWRFIRVRGATEFHRDREGTIARILRKLEVLGVPKSAPDVHDQACTTPSGLVEVVVRRAAELRSEWAQPADRESARAEESGETKKTDSIAAYSDHVETNNSFTAATDEACESVTAVSAASVAGLVPPASRSSTSDSAVPSPCPIPVVSNSESVSRRPVDTKDDGKPQSAKTQAPSRLFPGIDTRDDTRLSQRIMKLLRARPRLKAREIARELGVERNEINSLLYGELWLDVSADSEHRWSAKRPS